VLTKIAQHSPPKQCCRSRPLTTAYNAYNLALTIHKLPLVAARRKTHPRDDQHQQQRRPQQPVTHRMPPPPEPAARPLASSSGQRVHKKTVNSSPETSVADRDSVIPRSSRRGSRNPISNQQTSVGIDQYPTFGRFKGTLTARSTTAARVSKFVGSASATSVGVPDQHSTETAMLTVLSDILLAIDASFCTGATRHVGGLLHGYHAPCTS